MDDYACVNRKHISELKLEAYLTDNIVRLAEKYIYDVEVSKAAAGSAVHKNVTSRPSEGALIALTIFISTGILIRAFILKNPRLYALSLTRL